MNIIREMQILNILKIISQSIEWLKLKKKKKKKTENTKCWWRFGAPGVLALVRIENHSTSLKNCLAVPAKVKHTRTLWPSNYIPRILPRRNENTCLQKTYNSLIHNSQKLHTGQRFLNKNTDKILVYYYNAILFSNKKVQTSTSTWMNFKNIMLRERSQ